jgi:hypothetical protein
VKILYVDHPEADFLSAMVYLGLCQELGPENVIDWPWIPHFHGQTYNGPIPYGPGAIGTCSPYPWMRAQPGIAWSDREVFDRFAEFDLVVLTSPRAYNTERMRGLFSHRKPGGARFVMMDGEDYSTIRWDYIEEFRPSVYFKTSHRTNAHMPYPRQKKHMEGHVRIVSFPHATTFQSALRPEKDIDVCFLGGGNWHGVRREGVPENRPLMKPVLDGLLRTALPNANIVFGNVGYEQFQDTLSRSKISICVGGMGLEPVRTYESMSCPGTLVIRGNVDQLVPWPFVHGETCVVFNSHEEIPGLCQYWLTHDAERLAIAERGNALIWAHYTPRARAQQLLTEAFA